MGFQVLVMAFAALCLALISFTVGDAQAGFSNKWMEQDASVIGAVALNKLFIPGSHNSGSYQLIPPTDRPLNDKYPSNQPEIGVASSDWEKISVDWSSTVKRDLYGQLSDGIRFLDLEVCVDKIGDFRFCHNLYGPPVQDGLEQIALFATENPKEIVLVSFRGFYGWADDQTAAPFTESQHLFLKTFIQFNLEKQLINHSITKPNSTLNDIWAKNNKQSVVIIYDHVDSGQFWSSAAYVTHSYTDTWQVDEKKSSLVTGISVRTDSQLFVLDGYVTPSKNAFILSIDPKDGKNYPSGLKEMADSTNPALFDWIVNEWVPLSSLGMFNQLNIITIDFYHNTCLFHLTQNFNKIANATLDGCTISRSTNWPLWKASQSCPENYPDDVTKCKKPTAYGRGVGYAWKFGDPLNTSKQMERCEADMGKNNCEVWGAVVYPKCKDLFESYGCCMCTAECPGFLISVSPTSCLKV